MAKFTYRGTECEVEDQKMCDGHLRVRTWYRCIVMPATPWYSAHYNRKASAVRAAKRFIDKIIDNAVKAPSNAEERFYKKVEKEVSKWPAWKRRVHLTGHQNRYEND